MVFTGIFISDTDGHQRPSVLKNVTSNSNLNNVLLLRETTQGVILPVHVMPRSSQCGLVCIVNGFLKMKVTAPPVDGKANDECLNLLSASFNTPKNRLSILSGQQSRKKTILLSGIKKKDLEQTILSSHPHLLQDC